MHRREYLRGAGAAVATIGVAGCVDQLEEAAGLTEEPTHEYVPDAWSNQESQTGVTTGQATATVRLDAGEYTSEPWAPEQGVFVQIEARDQNGNSFEVFVVDEREFEERVREGKSSRFYNNLYGSGRYIQTAGTLQAGSYHLVVDNSAYGRIGTDGPVDVDFAMGIQLA